MSAFLLSYIRESNTFLKTQDVTTRKTKFNFEFPCEFIRKQQWTCGDLFILIHEYVNRESTY